MLKDSFKALANPTRIDILTLLSEAGKNGAKGNSGKQGELGVCKIVGSVPLSPSTISHHLNILKKAGLVKARKDRQWIYYSLDRDTIDKIKDYLTQL